MWKIFFITTCVLSVLNAEEIIWKLSNRELPPESNSQEKNSTNNEPNNQSSQNKTNLNLPSNATSIRENISDTFSCEGKSYGYYADTDNDCQIFHVCLPIDYGNSRAGRKMRVYKYSFICPETTMFDQEALTCNTEDQMRIDCIESPEYYEMSNTNNNDGAGKSTKTMESSTKPSYQQEKTTSKNLFEYSAFEESGISQKLLQRLPAYLFKQETPPQLNEELLETEGIQKEDDMATHSMQFKASQLEPQREQRTQTVGRRGFLFKADTPASLFNNHIRPSTTEHEEKKN